MKRVLNRFLAESMQRAGRDPAQAPQFATDEESVVQTILLANEARKNGIVVSDAAINDFLGKVTSGLVRPEQFEEIISGLRTGAAGVSQHHLFETIREQLLAQNLLNMLQHGFFGDPPGLRWDYFRRMEQSATVEVVPVDVRSVTDQVKTPQTAELRRFFEKYKEDLPNPRSDEPGFREPHRAKVEYVIARQGVFQEAISKEITDAEIAEFYEAKKATMFRAKPATPAPSSPAPEAPADTPPAEQPAAAEAVPADPTSDATPADAPAAPTEPAAADPATSPAEPATPPETPAEPGSPEKPADGSGAAVTGSPFRRVAYQAPDAEPEADAPAAEPKPEVPASAEPAVTEAAVTEPAVGEPAAAVPDAGAAAPEAVQFEPLEAVTERIRGQIARERATAKIDILFDRISSDIEGYNQDYALWKAREEARVRLPRALHFSSAAAKEVVVVLPVWGLHGAVLTNKEEVPIAPRHGNRLTRTQVGVLVRHVLMATAAVSTRAAVVAAPRKGRHVVHDSHAGPATARDLHRHAIRTKVRHNASRRWLVVTHDVIEAPAAS
jgi:hypothetical protein